MGKRYASNRSPEIMRPPSGRPQSQQRAALRSVTRLSGSSPDSWLSVPALRRVCRYREGVSVLRGIPQGSCRSMTVLERSLRKTFLRAVRRHYVSTTRDGRPAGSVVGVSFPNARHARATTVRRRSRGARGSRLGHRHRPVYGDEGATHEERDPGATPSSPRGPWRASRDRAP